jgi:hypothetical protein
MIVARVPGRCRNGVFRSRSGVFRALRKDKAIIGKCLMAVSGIGPIMSSATVAAIGHRRSILQGPRLRRLAWTGAAADLDRRPHSSW